MYIALFEYMFKYYNFLINSAISRHSLEIFFFSWSLSSPSHHCRPRSPWTCFRGIFDQRMSPSLFPAIVAFSIYSEAPSSHDDERIEFVLLLLLMRCSWRGHKKRISVKAGRWNECLRLPWRWRHGFWGEGGGRRDTVFKSHVYVVSSVFKNFGPNR